MKKVSALLLSIILLFTACSTTGGNVSMPLDRTASLMEALATSPTGEAADVEKDSAITPAAEIVKDVPSPEPLQEKEETEDAAEPEGVVETKTEAASESDTPAAVPEAVEPVAEDAEEEDAVVIPFEEKEESITLLPASQEESKDVIPVSGKEEEAEPVLYPVETIREIPVTEEESMAPWMINLMIILVVIMILFTASSAIRNAYKAPLNRLVSAAIALLLTSISWVLSYIILGPSPIYFAYLLLLGTYFVLRSTKRQDGE